MTNFGSLTHSPSTHPFEGSEKNVAHLMELRTGAGVVYVRPSRWQRMRLQWVFRNFHVLPLPVLSRRDQRLIARLARFAVVTPALPVLSRDVFGVIEKVQGAIFAEAITDPAWPLSTRIITMGTVGVLTAVCAAVIVALALSPRIRPASKMPAVAMQRGVSDPRPVASVAVREGPTSLPVAVKAKRRVAVPEAAASPIESPQIVPSTVLNRPLVSELPPGHFAHPIVAQRNLDGEVRLQALVGSDGTVKQVSVLSGDPRLAEAGVRAVRQWHFRPYDQLGQPVEVETRIKIKFFGQDAVSIASDTNESTAQLR